MASSRKKVAAKRRNGKKSNGPTNTTSTRYNATKHGLLATGITELDDAEAYHAIVRDLEQDKKPVGPIEIFLVKSAALDMIRAMRARRLEAEYITSQLNPPIETPGMLGNLGLGLDQPETIDPGLPAAIDAESAQRLVGAFQRYESSFTNRLFRTLHELERLQRMRLGETLPAPAVVDVTIHAPAGPIESVRDEMVDLVSSETGPVDLAPVAQQQSKALPSDGERMPEDVAVGAGIHAEAGMVDPSPGSPEAAEPLHDEEG